MSQMDSEFFDALVWREGGPEEVLLDVAERALVGLLHTQPWQEIEDIGDFDAALRAELGED